MEWVETTLQSVLGSPALFAFIVGIAGQVFGTQKLKFLLPAKWDDQRRKVTILLMSLGLTSPAWFIFAVGEWLESGFAWGPVWLGFWLWFLVWAAGTAIYEAWVSLQPPAVQQALSAKAEAQRRRRKLVDTLDGPVIRDADHPSDEDEITIMHLDDTEHRGR